MLRSLMQQHHGKHGHRYTWHRRSCKSAQWAVLPVRHMGFSGPASVVGVPGSCSSRADAGVPPRPIAPGMAGSGAVGTCSARQLDALGHMWCLLPELHLIPALVHSWQGTRCSCFEGVSLPLPWEAYASNAVVDCIFGKYLHAGRVHILGQAAVRVETSTGRAAWKAASQRSGSAASSADTLVPLAALYALLATHPQTVTASGAQARTRRRSSQSSHIILIPALCSVAHACLL